MAYIGRGTDSISNVEVLDNLTFDGSASYTLQKSSVNFVPSSANNLLISISGVVQQGNFSVSGSTITFDTTVSGSDTCDWILHYGTGLITTVADGTITEAKLGSNAVTTAKINDASVSLAKLTATGTKDATTFLRGDNTFAEVPAGGITEADQFRFTGTGTVGNSYLTQDQWIRNNTSFSLLGTGMSVSSGVFTFPSTGIYHIEFVISYRGQQAGYASQVGCEIGITTDNSTYNNRAKAYTSHQYDGNSQPYMQVRSTLIFDVTNTTTHKVKFYSMNDNISFTTLVGNSGANQTYATFIRLGDT